MSNKPNNAKRSVVYDADKLVSEIEDSAQPFNLKGEQFFVPSPLTWSDEIMELPMVEAARTLLGEDYDRFKSVGGNAALLNRIVGEIYGAEMGGSSASSGS
jgi:hypothetical protein